MSRRRLGRVCKYNPLARRSSTSHSTFAESLGLLSDLAKDYQFIAGYIVSDNADGSLVPAFAERGGFCSKGSGVARNRGDRTPTGMRQLAADSRQRII
ncbi:MAG TPA: hypothetical protein VJX28_10150 [Chthoniobacterales bacterium]|nr:hypothetical protein [Chthoniobacterales bacterium]